MENKVENKVAEQQEQPKKEEATNEKRAMKIRLKTGVMAGPVVAVHL
ncbi:hypothetical protein [Sorangium sp. So ce590]